MATNPLISDFVDTNYRIKNGTFLSDLLNNLGNHSYSDELNCEYPFLSTKFYKFTILHDILNQASPYSLKIIGSSPSNQDFFIIVREGQLISSEEKTIECLTKEIENYKKIPTENMLPLGFLIQNSKYYLFFHTKHEQMFSDVSELGKAGLESKFLLIYHLVSFMMEAHKNGVYGFCLNPLNLFYDACTKDVSLLGFFGNENTFGSIDYIVGIKWSVLNAPELQQGINFPTVESDIYQLGLLINALLSREIQKWGKGKYDLYLQTEEESLSDALRESTSPNPNERGELDQLYQCIQLCCENSIFNKNKETLQMIKANLPNLHLDQLPGMDLIVFLGNTQVGKSATINALRGCQFERKKKRLQQVTHLDDEASVGTVAGVSCTELPSVYLDQENNLAYLDTRGYNDIRQQGTSYDIATSFLIEIAIRTARNIRLVILEKFDKLKDGLAEFNSIGQNIQKIIKSQNAYVSCYFLFNRYTLSSPEDAEEFFSLSSRDQTKQILEEIIENVKNMYTADIDLEQYKYLILLFENINLYHFGYIDLTNQTSIENVRNELKGEYLNADRKYLRFTGYNKERIKFDQLFIPRLSTISRLLQAYEAMPDAKSLENVILHLSEDLGRYSVDLDTIQSCDDSTIHDQINSFEEKYSKISRKEMKYLTNNLEAAKRELEEVNDKINQFFREKAVIFSDNWRCEGGIHTYISKFSEEIPWVEDEVKLDNPETTKIIWKKGKPNTKSYSIKFENTSEPLHPAETCVIEGIGAGIVGAGYTIGYGLTGAMYLGVGGLFLMGIAPASITFGLLGGAAALAKGSLALGGLVAGGSTVAGVAISIDNIMHVPKPPITGCVTLCGLKKDIPSMQMEIVNLKGAANNLNAKILLLNQEINKLDNRNAEELITQLKEKIEEINSTIHLGHKLHHNITLLHQFFEANIDDISLYVEISQRLSGSDQNSDQSLFNYVGQFGQTLLDRIRNKEANVPEYQWKKNTIPSKVSELLEYIEQLKKDLETQEKFGIFDLNPFKHF